MTTRTGLFEIGRAVNIHAPIRPAAQRRKYPFETMAVGDMFFIPERTKNTIATHASTTGRRLGKRFATRLTYMRRTDQGWLPCASSDEAAVQGIGVWRVG